MKKNGKKKGKVAGGVGIVAVLAAVALLAGKGLGFGFGDGLGTGDGDGAKTNTEQSAEKQNEEVNEVTPQPGAESITIEVKQGQYLIDGEEKTLAEIEALLSEEAAAEKSYVLADNYASTKAWDDIKALFTAYEIDVVEQ